MCLNKIRIELKIFICVSILNILLLWMNFDYLYHLFNQFTNSLSKFIVFLYTKNLCGRHLKKYKHSIQSYPKTVFITMSVLIRYRYILRLSRSCYRRGTHKKRLLPLRRRFIDLLTSISDRNTWFFDLRQTFAQCVTLWPSDFFGVSQDFIDKNRWGIKRDDVISRF